MPGNIRVAVLEAVDLPSTVTAGKPVAVKVSVGKREFCTNPAEAQDGRTEPWNSEFLFPVLNLRDNLLVAIMDSKGDVVARAEIGTPGIVQKGFQDAFVTLKAGGRIHVKVSFVLSEEERKKIEAMRAAALRKRKGFPTQSPRGRQHPASTVKITEIPEETVETLNSTTKPSGKLDGHNGVVNQSVLTSERMETKGPLQTASSEVADVGMKKVKTLQDQVTKNSRQASIEDRSKKPEVENSKVYPEIGEGNRRSSFDWFAAADKSQLKHVDSTKAQAAAEGSQWLEGLKRKTKNDHVRAARADEWLRSRDAPVPAERQVAGSTRIQHVEEGKLLQGKSSSQAKAQKSVKQRLEDWKTKDLGPWKCSTRTKHSSPDSASRKSRWFLGNHKASIDSAQEQQTVAGLSREEQDLMAAADSMWASTVSQDRAKSNSSGSEKKNSGGSEKKNSGGGLKAAVKQVLSGAAAVAGALSIWPRRGSRKQERYRHTGTQKTVLPNEAETPCLKNCEDDLVYPGQRLPMP